MNPSPMIQDRPSPSPGTWPKGIGSREIHELLGTVLKGRWSLEAEYFSEREEGGAPLPWERMLVFEDPAPGVLVVRCAPGMEEALSDGSGTQSQEPFVELVVRIWREMVRRFFAKELKDLKPCRFRKSRPSEWPSRAPDAACLSLVEGSPVEVRLWMEGTAVRPSPGKNG